MKLEIPPASSPTPRVPPHVGGDAPLIKRSPSAQRSRGKKVILFFMVAASICVVASWAVFTVKPSWLAQVKSRLSLTGAPEGRRSAARYPSRPVFKVVPPRRTNPLPPATPPMMAEQMQRPQTLSPSITAAAPPPAYPVTRPQVSTAGGPQVSTPGAGGIPPAVPPSPTYPSTRPGDAVLGTPGMTPSMSAPSASPFPSEVRRPLTGTSSGQGSTSGFSPSKKEESESDEYLEIATLYAKKEKYQKAEELFQKVAKENPSSAKARNNLGVVCLRQKKYDMAEREFKEAIRLEPAFVLPYYNLACLYSRKGVDVESLIYLKKALNRDERVKQWVKTDKDFDRLRSDTVFQALVGGGSPVKKEAVSKKEGTQKTEGAQRQEGVRQPDSSLKKGETMKPETPSQEGTTTTEMQKGKGEIPLRSSPPQQSIPQQEEIQEQQGSPGSEQNQEGPPVTAPQDSQGGATQ